ncbi:MAG: tetratricopeptide repeat protein [Myxococcales bacterium]|nr:tetratricopeptide repeat protein [Myxococcales bacterium]
MRRSTDAIPAFEDTISLVVRKYGPAHPFLVSYYGNASQAYYNAGDHGAAIDRMRRALEIAEARTPQSSLLAQVLAGLGNMLGGDQRFAEALPYLERGLAIARSTIRANHPFIAQVLGDTGTVLIGLGRREEGRARIMEALSIFEANARPTLNWGVTLFMLGDAEAALKRWPEAIDAYGRARARLEAVVGKQAAYVLMARLGPAVVHARQGHWARTLAITTELLAARFDEESERTLSQVRFWHGAALAELGRDKAAGLAEAAAARAALAGSESTDPAVLTEIDTWLTAHGVTVVAPPKRQPADAKAE